MYSLALLTVASVTAISSGCAMQGGPNAAVQRCATALDSPIKNFCEVAPNTLWRGAKPSATDAAWLIQHGVKTVINLELLHDDLTAFAAAKPAVADRREIDYFRVRDWEPNAVLAPSVLDDHVAHFLALVGKQKQPVYVHCRSGLNRTGVMVAAYRVLIQGMSAETAIEEMGRYQGQWFVQDARYIRGLSATRRTTILRSVTKWSAAMEAPVRIVCEQSACAIVKG